MIETLSLELHQCSIDPLLYLQGWKGVLTIVDCT